MSGKPDPKPRKRIVDRAALNAKLANEPKCRKCKNAKATDPHHIVLKSKGGDDVEDNVVPLCRPCHREYHDGGELELNAREIAYVVDRLGTSAAFEYLKTRRLQQR